MDNMFGDDIVQQTEQSQVEVDPAAEFLAQQQDEIAGLENDLLGNSDGQTITNGYGNNGSELEEAASNDDFFNANSNELVTNAGSNYNENVDEPEEVLDPSQAYAAIAAADARLEQLRAEPEKIRIWREENTKLLAEKDRESDRKQQEWLTQARKELEDWQRNRQEQLEKTKVNNRLANESFVKEREAENQFVNERDQSNPGSEWERVSKLCDFNPKVAKGNKDVSRMRSTLLHLKQNPRPVQLQLDVQ